MPPTQHELNVQLLPSKPQYQPGEAASYTIKASDSGGKPVVAEFSLGVVDEAIYAIKPETAGSILNAFYGHVYYAGQHRQLADLLLQRPGGQAQDAAGQRASVARAGAAQAGTPGAAEDPQGLPRHRVLGCRSCAPAADGQATVKFDYPDAITSWRATTRGVTENTKVGSAVTNAIVRKNIMVRLVVPRFFRRGDEITLSTIVQNYLPTDKTAQVSMQFEGLQVLDGAQQNVNVPTPRAGEGRLPREGARR